MANIQSGFTTALTKGTYRWSHGKVLMTLATTLEQEEFKKSQLHEKMAMNLVRVGEKLATTAIASDSLQQKAKPWEIPVDVGDGLQFPPSCAENPEPRLSSS